MKLFLVRAIAFAAVGLLSGSVLSVMFPGSAVFPVLVFSFAIALTLSRGFLGSLTAVIMLGLSADLATLGRVGVLSGFSVGIAYTVSFFSRRFVVEHGALTAVFSGIFSGVSAILFPVFSDMLLYGVGAAFDRIPEVVSIGRVLSFGAVGVAFFVLATALIRKYDDVVAHIDPGSMLRLR